jgi:AraC-like DNA-binding protein
VTSLSDGATSFHFSTSGLPLHESGKSLRALYDRKLILVRLEPLPHRPFYADVTRRILPGLGIMSGRVCGLRHVGPPHGDDLFMFMSLAGCTISRNANHDVTLRGDALCGRPEKVGQTLDHPSDVRFMALRLPRRALAPLVASIDDAEMRIVPRDTAALRLLKTYVCAASDDEVLSTPELQRLFVNHVHDLVALALGATADAAFLADGRGVRAARLHAIKRDVAANLGRGELTVSAMAARHQVTPRYIHKLFEGGGITYSEFVRDQRLSQAFQMLTNPRLANRTISSLAYEVGFSDLSYFNRIFRRRFQMTPSEARDRQMVNKPPLADD